MSTVLIVAEIQNGAIRESSYELAAFAQKVAGETGGSVKGLVAGQGVDALAEEFAKKGGGEVYAAAYEAQALAALGAEPAPAVLAESVYAPAELAEALPEGGCLVGEGAAVVGPELEARAQGGWRAPWSCWTAAARAPGRPPRSPSP